MNGIGRGDDNQNKEKTSLLTRETVGMTLLLFGGVLLLITVTGPLLFGDVGLAIAAFFIGVFGYLAYPLFALLVYISFVMIFGRKRRLPMRWAARVGFFVLCVFFIVHTATAERFFGNGYGPYLSGCWGAASENILKGTGGGVMLGIVAYPVRFLLSAAGAYIIFSALLLLSVWLILRATPLRDKLSLRKSRARKETETKPVAFEDLPPSPRAKEGEREPAPSYAEEPAPSPRERAYPEGAYTGSGPYTGNGTYTGNGAYTGSGAYAGSRASEPARPSNRDILYGGDPASNYNANLIYDRDSYFNTRERRSSMEPNSAPSVVEHRYEQPSDRQPSNGQPTSSRETYSEQYADRAADRRPSMPRRVTEDRPAPSSGYSYPVQDDSEASYPRMPSYRAPEPAPSSENRDYYSHDVETFPSRRTPTPAEEAKVEPAPIAPAPDSAADRTERDFTDRGGRPFPDPTVERTERDFTDRGEGRSFTDLTGDRSDRGFAGRGDRSFSDLTGDRSDRGLDFGGDRGDRTDRGLDFGGDRTDRTDRSDRGLDFGGENTAEENEEQSTPAPSRDEQFRSLFSRPVVERTPIPDLPSKPTEPTEEPEDSSRSRVFDSPISPRSNADLFDDDEPDLPPAEPRGTDGGDEVPRTRTSVRERSESTRSIEPESEPAPEPAPHVYSPYVRPNLDLLRRYTDKKPITSDEIENNSAIIVDTLAALKQDVEVVGVTPGPAVIRYDLDIPKNIPVGAVTKHDDEIAMRLCAKDGVNMYNNMERGVVSIEVPKPKEMRSIVGLRSVLEADEYVNAPPNTLMFALGKDVEGRNVCADVVKLTHMLVAGSTGSGKSVFLNAMLLSLVCKYSPEDLRLILIDPKKVEFAIFEDLPHLMINEIIIDSQKAIMALTWAINEMERRYLLFEQKGRAIRGAVRGIDHYNACREEGEPKLPRILIVFDELADFMAVARKEIEDRVGRLAAKARAAGIHLVLATQRPSVNVITGVIKSNLPTRVAFRVIAEVDSRTILDETGAQKLLGNGDMLFRPESGAKRVQGAYVSDDEVRLILNEIKDKNEAYFDKSVSEFINKSSSSSGGDDSGGDDDEGASPEAIKALGIVVKLGSASISLIQRKCSIGYAHAGKIIEWMERMGYISAFDGTSKARNVILTKEEYEEKYGSLD